MIIKEEIVEMGGTQYKAITTMTDGCLVCGTVEYVEMTEEPDAPKRGRPRKESTEGVE